MSKGKKKQSLEKQLSIAKFWQTESQIRREQIDKSKEIKLQKQKADKMFVKPEDNETGPVSRPRPYDTASASAPAPPEIIYPVKKLAELNISQDQADTRITTRNGAKQHSSTSQTSASSSDAYPLIQVMNPTADIKGGSQFTLVFRPWTLEEARKAVEGVTSPLEDPDMWITDMQGIIHSYHLNGHETGEAAQSSLGKHWARMRSDYIGRGHTGVTLQYDAEHPNALDGDYKRQ